MAVKPKNISIAVDEPLRVPLALAMGLQHTFAMSSTLIMAALIVGAAGGSQSLTHDLIRITMIVVGLGSILQSINRGPVGSGYLCPSVAGPGFLPASILAAKTGGLSLLFGMLFVSGLFQIVISRFVDRLRTFLPPEVTGVIIAMVGISLIPIGVSLMAGLDAHDKDALPSEAALGVVTLTVMYALTVWGGRHLRSYSVLIGLVVGYAGAVAFSIMPAASLAFFDQADYLGLPRLHAPWEVSFDAALIVPFLIAGLVSSVKVIGVLTSCQKINDENWRAPEMGSIRRGVLASGLSVIAAGLLGGMAPAASSSNVGLSLATGVTSRVVGFFAGGLFIAFAFSPLLATVFVIMPSPVKGAILVYVACFMIVSGMQMIMSHVVNVRTIFIVGTSIIAGLSVDFLPDLYAHLPVELHALTRSPLAFSTVVAVLLNLVFRIGITRRMALEIDLSRPDIEEISRFMKRCGAEWGLRYGLVRQADDALIEFIDVALANHDHHKVKVEARFDQIDLDLLLHYRGPAIELPEAPPDADQLVEDERHLMGLSGYLIRRAATDCKHKSDGDNHVLHLRFAN